MWQDVSCGKKKWSYDFWELVEEKKWSYDFFRSRCRKAFGIFFLAQNSRVFWNPRSIICWGKQMDFFMFFHMKLFLTSEFGKKKWSYEMPEYDLFFSTAWFCRKMIIFFFDRFDMISFFFHSFDMIIFFLPQLWILAKKSETAGVSSDREIASLKSDIAPTRAAMHPRMRACAPTYAHPRPYTHAPGAHPHCAPLLHPHCACTYTPTHPPESVSLGVHDEINPKVLVTRTTLRGQGGVMQRTPKHAPQSLWKKKWSYQSCGKKNWSYQTCRKKKW